MHVVTANKGRSPRLCRIARRGRPRRRGIRFEAAAMDGAPVFNLWHYNLPGVRCWAHGRAEFHVESGGGNHWSARLARRRFESRARHGHHGSDGAFDVEGWDSAAKTAGWPTPNGRAHHAAAGFDARHCEADTGARRGNRAPGQDRALDQPRAPHRSRVSLRVRAEVLDRCDILAGEPGTSNLILFHTDLMARSAPVSIQRRWSRRPTRVSRTWST